MRGGGVFNALITTIVVIAVLVWMVTSLTNGDPLWFVKSFEDQATAFIVYWDGETYTVTPQDAAYANLMALYAKSIAQTVAFEWKVGFSEENIARYKDDFRMLEVQFAQPVQVHTRHPFNEAKTHLIPLNHTHSKWQRVFSFTGIMPYSSGPLNISPENFQALLTAVETVVNNQ